LAWYRAASARPMSVSTVSPGRDCVMPMLAVTRSPSG
jgi:hypothetical protein